MAGEVAEIEQAIGQENLARVMAGLYNQWWIQRREKETEWRELRNYLFATDTTTTTNSTLPWKNKTTLPKLTQIRDNLHANYMDPFLTIMSPMEFALQQKLTCCSFA